VAKGRKNKRLILILSAVVLLVIIAIGSLYYFFSVKADSFNVATSAGGSVKTLVGKKVVSSSSVPEKVPGVSLKINFTFTDKKTNKPLSGWDFERNTPRRVCTGPGFEDEDGNTLKGGCFDINRFDYYGLDGSDGTDSKGRDSITLYLYKIRQTVTFLGKQSTKDLYFLGDDGYFANDNISSWCWYDRIAIYGLHRNQMKDDSPLRVRLKTIKLPFFYTNDLNTAKTRIQKFKKDYTLPILSDRFKQDLAE